MRIKKTSATTPTNAKVVNTYSESTVDTYSSNYINEKNIYSTTQEIDTGKTLDGKKIYRSYISFAHSTTGNYTYNHNLGIETLVSANIFLSVANQTIASHGYRPNPYIVGSNSFMVSQITENTMVSQATGWSNNTVYAWLEYTKTS